MKKTCSYKKGTLYKPYIQTLEAMHRLNTILEVLTTTRLKKNTWNLEIPSHPKNKFNEREFTTNGHLQRGYEHQQFLLHIIQLYLTRDKEFYLYQNLQKTMVFVTEVTQPD